MIKIVFFQILNFVFVKALGGPEVGRSWYLWNHLELDTHIYPKVDRSWNELVLFGGIVDFGLRGSIFGAKNYVFGRIAIYL